MSVVKPPPSPPPEWAARALAAEFGRLPRIGILESARRHWLLVLLPVLLLVGVAAAVATRRSPIYTAESRLNVGRLNISTPGAIAGFAEAGQTLASAYSRVITVDGVVDPLAGQFRTTPSAIRSHVSATPVPSSSLVRVISTGSSAEQAIGLANAASNSLISYLAQLNQRDHGAVNLLKAVGAAAVDYQRTLAVVQRIHANGPLSPKAQIHAAALETAKLKLDSIKAAYQAAVQSQAVSSLLTPLTNANSATSDRSSVLQVSLFAALVLGAVVGLALATLRTNQTARRAFTATAWEPGESGSTH